MFLQLLHLSPTSSWCNVQVNPGDEAALAVVHRDPGLSAEQRSQSLQVLLQVRHYACSSTPFQGFTILSPAPASRKPCLLRPGMAPMRIWRAPS